MMHPNPEQEAIAKLQGLMPYFTVGPRPADRKLFLGFSLLTVLRPLNSVLMIMASFSLLLGMIAYVYGDALAMVAPILCHTWLRLNLLVFRQPVHYLIFLAAYGASLVSITISSIVWMALMANKDNITKHRTVALVYANDRYFVVVVWFMLQLLIAVLGSLLLYLVFLAYKAQSAPCSAQAGSSDEGNVEAGRQQSRPVELSAIRLDASQDHSSHRQQEHYARREHSRGRVHAQESDDRHDAANPQYDHVYDEVEESRTSRQTTHTERSYENEDGVGSAPQDASTDARPAQKKEKGFLKTVKLGIAAAKVAEDATRLGRAVEKTAKARQSGDARPEKEAEAAFEQVSAAGKLTQDSAKLARMTKQAKVNEVRTTDNAEQNEPSQATEASLERRDDSRNSSDEHHEERRHSSSGRISGHDDARHTDRDDDPDPSRHHSSISSEERRMHLHNERLAERHLPHGSDDESDHCERHRHT